MTIEKQYQKVRDIEGLQDHLIKIVEDNDERFSFEWGSCGIKNL